MGKRQFLEHFLATNFPPYLAKLSVEHSFGFYLVKTTNRIFSRKTKYFLLFQDQKGFRYGGGGGGLNSPSRNRLPECATSLAVSLISPERPLTAKSGQASRLFLAGPYQRPNRSIPICRHPIPIYREEVGSDALPYLGCDWNCFVGSCFFATF